MKQMLKSVLMILVVLVCATSLAFAGGDKTRKRNESQTKKRSGESYQMNLDGKLFLSAIEIEQRTISEGVMAPVNKI